MTTEAVKITHTNKDQAGIIHVYVFTPGPLCYPLNLDMIFINVIFWRVPRKRLGSRFADWGIRIEPKDLQESVLTCKFTGKRWLISLSPCGVCPVLSPASVNMPAYATCDWNVPPFLLYLALLSSSEKEKRDLRLGSG